MTAARRLAAILAANVAEYSRLIAVDDADTPKPQVGPLPRTALPAMGVVGRNPYENPKKVFLVDRA